MRMETVTQNSLKDKELDYNGDHSFLKSHPEFNLAPQKE